MTALYLDGDKLRKRTSLVFCNDIGAKNNPDSSTHPHWKAHVDFQWVSRASTLRYLGCQVGIDIFGE